MVGCGIGRPLSGPWLTREKARAFCLPCVPSRRQPPPDQLAERNAERFGLTVCAPAQFVWKQDSRAMHMASLTSIYGGVNFQIGKNPSGRNHQTPAHHCHARETTSIPPPHTKAHQPLAINQLAEKSTSHAGSSRKTTASASRRRARARP